MPTCSTCRFWDPTESRQRGLCRRNAPRSHLGPAGMDVPVQAVWPETLSADWCGQHTEMANTSTMPAHRPRTSIDDLPRPRPVMP